MATESGTANGETGSASSSESQSVTSFVSSSSNSAGNNLLACLDFLSAENTGGNSESGSAGSGSFDAGAGATGTLDSGTTVFVISAGADATGLDSVGAAGFVDWRFPFDFDFLDFFVFFDLDFRFFGLTGSLGSLGCSALATVIGDEGGDGSGSFFSVVVDLAVGRTGVVSGNCAGGSVLVFAGGGLKSLLLGNTGPIFFAAPLLFERRERIGLIGPIVSSSGLATEGFEAGGVLGGLVFGGADEG